MRRAFAITCLLLATGAAQAQTRGLIGSNYGANSPPPEGCEPADVSDEGMARMQAQVTSLMSSHATLGASRDAQVDQDAIAQRRQELAAAAQDGRLSNPAPATRAEGEDPFKSPLDGQTTVLQGRCGAAAPTSGRR